MATVQELLSDIKAATDRSSQSNETAKSISVTNFFSTTPILINELQDILKILTSVCEQNGECGTKDTSNTGELECPPYSENNQQAISNSFKGFVAVHRELLSTLIGKHGLLEKTPFIQPLAQALRLLEGGWDTMAYGIIDVVPACAQVVTTSKVSLDACYEDALNTYNS